MAAGRSRFIYIAGVLAVAASTGGVAWFFWPEPPAPEPEAVLEADDAQPTRDETEDFMREIGYVQ